MNKIVLLIFSVVISIACQAQKTTHYGEKINAKNAITEAQLLKKMEAKDEVKAKLTGVINQTCAVKGCWMTMSLSNGEEMRVTFKDYGFFVPTEGVSGKKVIVDGIAKKETTDVETLRHYAKDAGQTDEEIASITEDKQELNFVADGVIIFD